MWLAARILRRRSTISWQASTMHGDRFSSREETTITTDFFPAVLKRATRSSWTTSGSYTTSTESLILLIAIAAKEQYRNNIQILTISIIMSEEETLWVMVRATKWAKIFELSFIDKMIEATIITIIERTATIWDSQKSWRRLQWNSWPTSTQTLRRKGHCSTVSSRQSIRETTRTITSEEQLTR